MDNINWLDEIDVAITVCDEKGIISYMNKKSEQTFEKDGGRELIGTSLYDCHDDNAKRQIKEQMRDMKLNCYTIEKKGKKKLIYQVPCIEDEKLKGIAELSFVIPEEMPHFKRD